MATRCGSEMKDLHISALWMGIALLQVLWKW